MEFKAHRENDKLKNDVAGLQKDVDRLQAEVGDLTERNSNLRELLKAEKQNVAEVVDIATQTYREKLTAEAEVRRLMEMTLYD